MYSAACNFSANIFPFSVKTALHPRGVARLFIIPCASRRCSACRMRLAGETATSPGKSLLLRTASGANAAEAERVVILKRARMTFWRIRIRFAFSFVCVSIFPINHIIHDRYLYGLSFSHVYNLQRNPAAPFGSDRIQTTLLEPLPELAGDEGVCPPTH